LLGNGIPLRHRAVTVLAFNLLMPRVAEIYVVFYNVHLFPGKRCRIITEGLKTLDLGAVRLHHAMAVHALRYRWERSALAGFDRGVAIAALDLEQRVSLMTELDRLSGRCQRYGNEKTTSESE
jgi:hypothetical protein